MQITSPLNPDSSSVPFLPYKNTIKKSFFGKAATWEEMPDRQILTNVPDFDIGPNSIHTSKYNCLTFVPKNLVEQFSKLANFYFLIIGFLQMIKEISTSGGVPVTFAPLAFIIVVSAIKDLYEDLKRHKSDNEENNRKTLVLTQFGWEKRSWETLRVGNLVKVLCDEYLPADILIMATSEKKGACYIETKNLDGETNLKHKRVHKDMEFIGNLDEKQLYELNDGFSYERPNPYLYAFKGTYILKNGTKFSLDQNNFILRGCSIRNTKYIIGVVAYSGHDTKIMLNSTKARAKSSKVEHLMNKLIITVFIFQIMFCMFSAFFSSFWYLAKKHELDYLEIDQSSAKDNYFHYNFFVRFGNWLIIFQNFVPISLIVTLEMVKLFQGILMTKDEKMKFLQNNTYVAVQTSSLNEELGQVEYIFSDKTGTLTCNFMEFKKISVGGVSYGEDNSLPQEIINQKPKVTNVDFKDNNFFNEVEKGNNLLNEMLLGVALCHTILTEVKDNGEIVYNASSPDELALVNWAKFCGVEFSGIDENNFMNVKFFDNVIKYELLHVLEFNSTRKRQSVILKSPEGKIILYIKGADSIIAQRLRSKNDELKSITWTHLEKYASIGLRTLLIAKREINQNEYQDWSNKYHEACTSIQNRDEKMQNIQELIEVELDIVGATAIEDKLQDEVGSTISSLKKAGIKVWVLTGDKVETAINIGYSCQLLNDSLQKITIDGHQEDQLLESLQKGLDLVNSNQQEYALIVTGDALIICSQKPFSDKLLAIAEKCNAVIACRVSPKQKQEVVSLVRNAKPNVTTLAIGDGANDVNMITAAHVGIGIRGVEGLQAARASDYSIGEFKVLKRLLLFCGRECYRRNSYLICYNFFKNLILVLPQFWFGFFNGLSGQTIYNPFLFQLYNIFYASLPIVIYAVLDKENKGSFFINNPQTYTLGLKNKIFNVNNFWRWIFFGIWQSCLLTLFTFFSLTENFNEKENGYTLGMWGSGMAVFGILIVVTNIKVLIMTNNHTVLSLIINFGSILLYIITFSISSAVGKIFDDYGSFARIFSAGAFYFILFLIILSTNIIDLAINRFKYFLDAKEIDDYLKLNESSLQVEIVSDIEKKKKEFIEKMIERKYTGYAYSQEDMIDPYYKFAQN